MFVPLVLAALFALPAPPTLWPARDDNGRYGYIDATGKPVIEYRFTEAKPFDGGVATVKLARWGLIDATGKTLVAFDADDPIEFRGDVALVKHAKGSGLYGPMDVVDRSGKVLVTRVGFPLEGDRQSGFHSVTLGGASVLLDVQKEAGRMITDGKTTRKVPDASAGESRPGEGVLRAKSQTKPPAGQTLYTLYSLAFEPFDVEDLQDFTADGIAPFKRGGKWGLLGKDGKVRKEPVWDNVTEADTGSGRFSFSTAGKWGLADATGKELTKAQWDTVVACSERRCFVKEGDLFGLTDLDGKPVAKPAYISTGTFVDGIARVYAPPAGPPNVEAWIDEQGNWITTARYEFASEMRNGRAWARPKKEDKLTLFDDKGKPVPGALAVDAGIAFSGALAHYELRDSAAPPKAIEEGWIDRSGKIVQRNHAEQIGRELASAEAILQSQATPEAKKEAIATLVRLAALGKARASSDLASIALSEGRIADIAPLIKKAAEGGDPSAMSDLGRLTRTGEIGLTKDAAAAQLWLERAADAGTPLGLWERVQRLPAGTDPEERTRLLAIAVSAGSPEAQVELAKVLHATAEKGTCGQGTRSYIDACESLARAIRSQTPSAFEAAAMLGHWVVREGTKIYEQIARASDVFKVMVQAADAGNANAQLDAGVGYRDGIATTKDLKKARLYLEKARTGNHPEAAAQLELLTKAEAAP